MKQGHWNRLVIWRWLGALFVRFEFCVTDKQKEVKTSNRRVLPGETGVPRGFDISPNGLK